VATEVAGCPVVPSGGTPFGDPAGLC
jgi:hypothetical protein